MGIGRAELTTSDLEGMAFDVWRCETVDTELVSQFDRI